ncbi:hypothetical protein PM082_016629 [Marasmius tenuissimus]|nr:hypothetical protein PM082_016629 [Marasmius tenuissimus]
MKSSSHHTETFSPSTSSAQSKKSSTLEEDAQPVPPIYAQSVMAFNAPRPASI